jgi:prepilin-type N-terminal cleavage/methylation domain-containing protein
MKSTSSTKRSGFTLIELLTVIAIIGILAAVLFPGVQGVMKKAKQSTASTKLRNIVQAVISYSDGKKYIKTGSWSVTNNSSASSIAEYAAVLAYNSSLNAGEIWYVDADKLNESASFPKQVLTGAVGSQQIDTNFKTPSDTYGWHSWTAYTPTAKNLDGNIPLLWSRGLSDATGAWDAADGVWGADGGHIGYGDSHVIWTANTTDDGNGNAIFVDKSTGAATADWKKAASSGQVQILSSK